MSIWGKSIKGKVRSKGKDPEVEAALEMGTGRRPVWSEESEHAGEE